jgi:hypothetical protein
MTTFMLWFDNSDKSLTDKVKLAAAHFQKKYGKKPELCLVPISMEPGDNMEVDGVTVRTWTQALPGHLYVGCEDEPKFEEGAPA